MNTHTSIFLVFLKPMLILIFLCIRAISAQRPVNDGFIDFLPYSIAPHAPSPHDLKHALHNMNDIPPHSQHVNKKYYINDDHHYQDGNWQMSNKHYSRKGAKHPNKNNKLRENSNQYYQGRKPSNMDNKYYPQYNYGVKPSYISNKHRGNKKQHDQEGNNKYYQEDNLASGNQYYQEDNLLTNNQYYQEDNLYANNQYYQVANPLNANNIRNEVEHKDQEISPLENTSDLQMDLDQKIKAIIKKLTDILQILNKNLEGQIRMTQKRRLRKANLKNLQENNHTRNKRDVEEVTETTEAITESAQEKYETVENQSTENSNLVPASSDCNQTFHSRRTFSEDLEVSSAVKNRLLSYINEYFSDIDNKIISLHDVKNALAADDEYNIGYIIANIDMLDTNMKNLKIEMERSRLYLGERHILDMFDKVKVSNNLVANLLGALKNILDKKGKAREQKYYYPVNGNYV